MFSSYVSDIIPSYFDLWMIGDSFLQDAYNSLQNTINAAQENRQLTKLYIQEFYNISNFANPIPQECKIANIINGLITAVNEKHKLPRFLLVIIDKDILEDINVFNPDAIQAIRAAVDWVV